MLKITLICCSNKLPLWISEGVNEFSKRLKEFVQLTIIEIPLIKRNKPSDLSRILEKESVAMIAAIPAQAYVIALSIEGQTFSSEKLALKLAKINESTQHLCFLIGGPEGLSKKTLDCAAQQWSLSALTLPHALVRLILLEALYRAWSILTNHPYHK